MLRKTLTFLNTKICPPEQKYKYHVPIEQYRGLCALLVLIAHGVSHADILKDDFSWPLFMHYLGAGQLSVIIFFTISGYVIGVSNTQNQLSVKQYLKKRAVRLYPAYIFSILICAIVAGGISMLVLTQNLLFLENFYSYCGIKIPMYVNIASWSLNYEVVYYLLFIPLFFAQPKVWHLLICMLLLSVALLHCPPGIVFLANYINGFYFWVLGLFFGWRIMGGTEKDHLTIPLLSLLFLHICFDHLQVGLMITTIAGLKSETNINWLFELPFCLMILGILTKNDNTALTVNKVICYVFPFFVFLFLVLHHKFFEFIRWPMCFIFWCLSLIFYNEKKISAFLLEKLTIIGKISYALYLFHVPVAYLIKKTVSINNQPIELIVKYSLWITLTFGLSYFVDIICQPAIKRIFFPIK